MRVVDVLSSQNHFLFGIVLVVLFRPALGGAGAIMLAVGLAALAVARAHRARGAAVGA